MRVGSLDKCRKKRSSVVGRDGRGKHGPMAILALALYGSRARGDNNRSSDIDLLLVTDDERPGHSQKGSISMSSYSLRALKERASEGDLFLYHLVFEGRPLYDPDNHFPGLRTAFRLKRSYSTEIQKAVDLGWFIVGFGESISNRSLLSRRITWVVRTILIATAAETGRPIFSREELLNIAPGPQTRRLIAQKDTSEPDPRCGRDLEWFLMKYGRRPSISTKLARDEYIEMFKETKNDVALHLIVSTPRAPVEGYT
ncbi:nucleotidyltransferase domain-containing protein [Mesorhizobium sp. M0045]|uniref:anti-phage Hailong system nucleotidyltransferase HalB n=1 Tax=Mesorhizobium sp. M0045 TaxID=2956857 RepID=UPI0033390488